MSAIVVDASIAAKWFFPEPHAEAARHVLRDRRRLLAPELIWAEVINVLWKRVQRAELAREAAGQILLDFKRFPLKTYPIKALLELAWSVAVQHRLSVYDGLYLALAISRDCKLVTADRPFYDAIKVGPLAASIVWVEHVH